MEERLEELMSFCSILEIAISSALRPRYSQSSGVGLYAVSSIKQGQQIIRAPKTSLLTTESIPKKFFPDENIRAELTVHGLLATWLAFGDSTTLRVKYGPWMSTWPSWLSFRDTMPVFWHSRLDKSVPSNGSQGPPESKRRRTVSKAASKSVTNGASNTRSRDFSLSPAIEGWSLSSPPSTHKTLRDQIDKIRKIMLILHERQDLLGFDILADECRDQYEKFLHMWCCVNSRCFYYVPLGMKAPKDPNEAMALVPFVDLFNHTTHGPGADVKVTKDFFIVVADKDYAAGEEVFIQYGPHSNDALWIEYGFMLDENSHDELDLDQLILKDLNEEQKELLRSTNYLGEYTLNASGVSYRMETVAWLASGAMSYEQWENMVQGIYDPEDEGTERYEQLRLSMWKQIVTWLVNARLNCENSIEKLSHMQASLQDYLAEFAPLNELLRSDRGGDVKTRTQIAGSRLDMCLTRWQQSHAICIATLDKIALDHPAAVGENAAQRE